MNIACLPFNPRGTIALGKVSPIAISTGDRAASPLPPGNVQVNGDSWPDGKTYTGDVTLTWAHRNRTARTGLAIVQQDAVSVGSPEGSYTIDVLIAGIVKLTATGITGTSFTYTHAQRVADDANLANPVQFRITPVNGALVGTVRTTDVFIMS